MITKTQFHIVNRKKLFDLSPVTVDGKCEFETHEEAERALASLQAASEAAGTDEKYCITRCDPHFEFSVGDRICFTHANESVNGIVTNIRNPFSEGYRFEIGDIVQFCCKGICGIGKVIDAKTTEEGWPEGCVATLAYVVQYEGEGCLDASLLYKNPRLQMRWMVIYKKYDIVNL